MVDKKISIIVPVYNAEKFLEKCLDCLLGQTYKNLEIILVNDGSKGNCKEIYEKYKKKDSRIKYVEHEKNKGLFQTRITGVNASTGDYIAFLDSDDHVTVDFFRALIYKAEETKSDITFANMILEFVSDEDTTQIQYNLFDTEFEELNGEEALEEYFNQEGLNFSWHTTPNKIYSRRLWEQALDDYKAMDKHLIMTEDFSFSSVLFYYAKKVTKVDTEAMFYCKHKDASTSVENVTYKKIEKNLTDLATSFNFVENFLKKKNVFTKYQEKFEKWKALYVKQHKAVVENIKLSTEEKQNVKKLFSDINSTYELKDEYDIFTTIQTDWNNELHNVKTQILDPKIKCVSFDIFDTLVVRPFYMPKDLFMLLNKYFEKISNNITSLDFSDIRENAEAVARKQLNSKKQEITIDEIYLKIGELYRIPTNVLDHMKEMEKQYEIRFCTRRNTAYQLYQLAKYLNKKVICTSDMYLNKFDLKNILDKNGYIDLDEIFVSCDLNKTKDSGELFNVVCEKMNLNPEEIIHIGDNYRSDYENPKKMGMKSIFFPKATAIASDPNFSNNMFQIFLKDLPFWEDNVASMQFLGIRCMLALVANKYFDNPYRSFNKISNFNGDPALIGYFVLGMYLFGISKWLIDEIEENKYDSMVFMARDGYLPMEAYKLFKNVYKNLPEEKYLYVSRKALIPAIIQSKNDYYKLPEVINIYKNSPRKVFKYIKDTIIYDEEKLKNICNDNEINIDKNFDDLVEFNKFTQIIIDNFYDANKHTKNLSKLKEYYNLFYQGNSANFDIGYSGRPEFFISKLCDKSIDTYFININGDIADRYAEKGNFKLSTFMEYKPHITGNFYELCVSAKAPSCIGYNFDNPEITPIFEKYESKYQEEFVMKKIQNNALKFVNDMLNIFGEEIQELHYQNYYITLPVQSYVHSANEFDRRIFDAFSFEDDVRIKNRISVNELWNNELGLHNQRNIDEVLNGVMACNQINTIDLSERSKFVRLIYYTFFDRVTLKRRVNEILYKHKFLRKIARKVYNTAKKLKKHK